MNAEPNDRRMLRIGGVEGGGRIAAVEIQRAALAAFDLTHDVHARLPDLALGPDEIALRVVFVYPGSVWQPEFAGTRVTLWAKADRELTVDVAIAQGTDLPSADAKAFVADQLRTALHLLKAEVDAGNINGSTRSVERVVDAVLSDERFATCRKTLGILWWLFPVSRARWVGAPSLRGPSLLDHRCV